MSKRILALFLCVLMFALLLPAAAFAENDYDVITIKKGDTVKKLLEANGRDYKKDKYLVMVLNHMDRESDMEILTIGNTIKIPKRESDIEGPATHLISQKDNIEYYVIPYKIQKGDTLKYIYKLWGLSYDTYSDKIKALNPDKDLDTLYIGDLYYLPTTENNLHTKVYITVMGHILQAGESIEGVFSSYGMDFKDKQDYLQSFNVKDFNNMLVGDKLLVPLVW